MKGNTSNQFYVAQWINLFFTQAMMQNSDEKTFRTEHTITEILSNNKKLLDKQITREIIEHFVDLFKSQKKNERFLTLLSALCYCNEDAVASNQNNITELLLEDDETKGALIMKIRSNLSGHVQIFVNEEEIEDWVAFDKFQEFSRVRDNGRLYQYLIALIDLSSNLCY